MLQESKMLVELDESEWTLLREVIANVVRDLSPEIADTDNPLYRRMLLVRRTELQAMLNKLGGPVSVN
jgi:hypothetical protein